MIQKDQAQQDIYRVLFSQRSSKDDESNPCPNLPPSSDSQEISVRLGEVGLYAAYTCLWRNSQLACHEPLQGSYTTVIPDLVGGALTTFIETSFTDPFPGIKFQGYSEPRENPFSLGFWSLDVDEYVLETSGFSCGSSVMLSHKAVIKVQKPSVFFDQARSQCPPVTYSLGGNAAGSIGANPLYPDKEGCSIVHRIKQPSYPAKYGVLEVLSQGYITMNAKSSKGDSLEKTILRVSSSALDCKGKSLDQCSPITNKGSVSSGQEMDFLHMGKNSLFAAPHFSQSCQANESDLFTVSSYQNLGTQAYAFLMMKPDPQEGKKSYWIPVGKAGWFSSYSLSCPEGACGVGLGEEEGSAYSNPWTLADAESMNPWTLSLTQSPPFWMWGDVLTTAYQTISMTDFNEMDYWLSCPSSSYPFEEAVSASPPSYGEEL